VVHVAGEAGKGVLMFVLYVVSFPLLLALVGFLQAAAPYAIAV
jgi:hypothetical protein